MRNRQLALLAVLVATQGATFARSLVGQTILIGGVPVSLGDQKAATVAALSRLFELDAHDSINFAIREPTNKGFLIIGSVTFGGGVVTLASRSWYDGDGGNRDHDDRALAVAFMGALQSLGVSGQGTTISAKYQTVQDPTTLLRIATFTSGRRSVTVYYSEETNGARNVQVSEVVGTPPRR